jgi:hypothetical protein
VTRVDTIRAEQGRELELPAATIDALRTVGVPRELRLAGWLGPTLFSSEIGDGRVSEGEHGYLIGSIRETLSAAGTGVYARFWIQRGTGTVLWESLGRHEAKFVNSDVQSFVSLLKFLCTAWDAIGDSNADDIQRLIQQLVSEISRLDPLALKDAETYWPCWVEELKTHRDG